SDTHTLTLHSLPTRRSSDLSSTKLTPLTTRPPVTSRQGMMRLASMSGPQLVGTRLGGREVQIARVDGAAGDDTLDAFVLHRTQGDRKSTRLNSSHVKSSYAV